MSKDKKLVQLKDVYGDSPDESANKNSLNPDSKSSSEVVESP